MAADKDVEQGDNRLEAEIREPLIQERKIEPHEEDGIEKESKGSDWMVYLSTFVVVWGSFAFGSCAGYSSPTQAAIRGDLNLSLGEALRTAFTFCVAGWLSIYFAKHFDDNGTIMYLGEEKSSEKRSAAMGREKKKTIGEAEAISVSGYSLEYGVCDAGSSSPDLTHGSPQLYWLCIVRLAYGVFFVVSSAVAGLAVCCCLPFYFAIDIIFKDREESGNVAGTSADKQKIEENGVPVKALLPLAQWNVVKAQYDAYVHSLHAELDAAEAARDAAVEAAKAAVAALDASHSHLIMAQIALDETEGKVKVVQGEVTNLGGVPLADSLLFLQGTLALDIGRLATGYGMGVFSYVEKVYDDMYMPITSSTAHDMLRSVFVIYNRDGSTMEDSGSNWIDPMHYSACWSIFHSRISKMAGKNWTLKEFEVALQKLRGKDADITVEAAEIQDYIDTLERLPKSGMLDLFQRRYLRSVMIGVGLMVCQQFGGINGICFYTSEIFASAGFPSNIGTITYACLQVVVTAIGASLIDRAGRRVLLLTSGTGLVVGCLIAALSFYLKSHELSLEAVPALAATGILVYIGSFSIGMGAVPWVVMSEIFPINVKGAAGSLATLVNWFGSWLCSFTFNYLMSWSSYGGICVAYSNSNQGGSPSFFRRVHHQLLDTPSHQAFRFQRQFYGLAACLYSSEWKMQRRAEALGVSSNNNSSRQKTAPTTQQQQQQQPTQTAAAAADNTYSSRQKAAPSTAQQ
ncbi:hypothetical protein IFM89_015878 [Coptis chinensis]|uniref:Major facilitator superfamily (MFS) profile domain-containing protein n=1 Tax=Coptis chinensis TaxID=261450 RepID=A0A835HW23_9MAGN|nr:hypothetical protein IFM89_015878 [Coptis chinensis]